MRSVREVRGDRAGARVASLALALWCSVGFAQTPALAPTEGGVLQKPRPTRVPPVARVVPLDCSSQGANAREFCGAYNVAIAQCADKRAAADIRECIQALVPGAPSPACPPSGARDVSSADRGACEQQQARHAGCTGRVGEAYRACRAAQVPVLAERVAPSRPAPVGVVLPVAAQVGAGLPAGVPPLPAIEPMAPGRGEASAGAPPPPPPPQLPAPPGMTR
jgi:hypothetical protein